MLGWTPFFQGPFYGVSLFSAGVVLAVMIIPVHHLDLAGSDPRGSRRSAGSRVWRWAPRVGRPPGTLSFPIAKKGHHGFDLPRAGARAGRDHGRHHGHRQRSQDQSLAVCARLFHRRRDRQRIHRSHRRLYTERPDRTRLGAVRPDHRDQRRGSRAGPHRGKGADRSKAGYDRMLHTSAAKRSTPSC